MALRIVTCTNGGIYGAVVLDRLLACNRIQVVGLIESSRVLRSRYSWWRGAVEQIRLSGPSYALYLWCATSFSDVLGQLSPLGSVSAQAHQHAIPKLVTRDVNDARGRSFLQDLAPDLLISAFFNQRIAQPVFTIPRLGGINIHPSLLPDCRGVDPVFFATLRGVQILGVTVHRIDADFDTGNILVKEAVPLPPGQSLLKITALLFRRGAELVVAHLDEIAQMAHGTAQEREGAYDSWPSASEVRRLRRGTRLVRLRDLVAIASGSLTEA